MRRNVLEMVTLLILLTLAAPAHAELPHVFKHDQFSDSIAAASQELSGIPLGTQAGFVPGEAFGVIYKPLEYMYPVKIQGIDVVMAAMPYDLEGSQAHAVIEIYFFDGEGPDPGGAPVFTLSTHDVFNEAIMDLGAPLKGNTAMSFEFDWGDAQGHPPLLTTGSFLVAIRFTEAVMDLEVQWGTYQCGIEPILGMCGCQKVGTLHDQMSTPGGNVLHIIDPPGTCDGGIATKWYSFATLGVTGDVILRARASVADAPCVPSCLDKECGDNGCEGSCGQCTGAGESCVAGMCEACAPACGVNECGDDGCGGTCGTCGAGEDCVQGACQGPCVPVCEGKACGADQCGGSCGDCAADKTCNASGQCVGEGVCDPVANCIGKNCGTDGCGGFCGICPEGEDCVQGACSGGGGEEEEGTFTIKFVSPDEGCNDEDTAITITGTKFVDGMTVQLTNAQSQEYLVAVTLDSTMIRATVPAGMKTASYDLIIIAPDETSKLYPGAYKVTRCGDTGCGVGDPSRATGLGLLLLLAGLALAWRRVRA
ncbi:MAG: IPT/TIG domain-containing protein [Pseudomonadota bacterium]